MKFLFQIKSKGKNKHIYDKSYFQTVIVQKTKTYEQKLSFSVFDLKNEILFTYR